MKYTNFFETLEEAQARVNRTIVLYGEQPCEVFAITNHMKDGVFRTWLCPIGLSDEDNTKVRPFYNMASAYNPDSPKLGKELDAILEKNPDTPVMRKFMNSAKFNRFLPFPLGMCNFDTQCFYVERQPIRPRMEQGLVAGALFETLITTGSRKDNPSRVPEKISITSPEFRDCILADHHSPDAVLKALTDPNIANDAHAFHREFALVRGPIDMIFLAYRTDVIGVLPHNDFSLLRLGREFNHCREAVAELDLFTRIY